MLELPDKSLFFGHPTKQVCIEETFWQKMRLLELCTALSSQRAVRRDVPSTHVQNLQNQRFPSQAS